MQIDYSLDEKLYKNNFEIIHGVFLTYEPNFSNKSENHDAIIEFL